MSMAWTQRPPGRGTTPLTRSASRPRSNGNSDASRDIVLRRLAEATALMQVLPLEKAISSAECRLGRAHPQLTKARHALAIAKQHQSLHHDLAAMAARIQPRIDCADRWELSEMRDDLRRDLEKAKLYNLSTEHISSHVWLLERIAARIERREPEAGYAPNSAPSRPRKASHPHDLADAYDYDDDCKKADYRLFGGSPQPSAPSSPLPQPPFATLPRGHGAVQWDPATWKNLEQMMQTMVDQVEMRLRSDLQMVERRVTDMLLVFNSPQVGGAACRPSRSSSIAATLPQDRADHTRPAAATASPSHKTKPSQSAARSSPSTPTGKVNAGRGPGRSPASRESDQDFEKLQTELAALEQESAAAVATANRVGTSHQALEKKYKALEKKAAEQELATKQASLKAEQEKIGKKGVSLMAAKAKEKSEGAADGGSTPASSPPAPSPSEPKAKGGGLSLGKFAAKAKAKASAGSPADAAATAAAATTPASALSKEDFLKAVHSAFRWQKPHEEIETLIKEGGTTLREIAAVPDPKNGNQCLHITAQNGHADLTKWLIEAKADINATNLKGQTPLHMSIEYDFYFQSLLLMNAGADRNAKNNDGHPAILGIDGKKVDDEAWDHPIIVLKAAGDDKAELETAMNMLEAADASKLDKAALVSAGMAKKKSCPNNWSVPRFQALMKKL